MENITPYVADVWELTNQRREILLGLEIDFVFNQKTVIDTAAK